MGIAPNKQSVVEACVSEFRPAWLKCLTPGDDGEFIRLVATKLNSEDPRWGLNAKRDGPTHDISKDVLAYYVGPTDRHVECFDVIGAHESSSARIVWNDITNYSTIGNPGTARFVHPVNNGGYQGEPTTPPSLPEPVYTTQEAINYLTARKGSPLSPAEVANAVNRAQQLGWNGGSTIKQSIIHQIANEMFPSNQPGPVVIEATITNSGVYPVGTKIKIQIG